MTAENNPIEAARIAARPTLPARFYAEARTERDGDWFVLMLDGKPALTPARHRLGVPEAALAEALAAEWNGQGERIDPATMPVTQLVNAALDRVAGEMAAVRKEIVRYVGSDLVCYRADEPEGLAGRQREAWDPLVAWAEREFGVSLRLADGVVAVEQAPELGAAVDEALTRLEAIPLTGVHAATTLTGSAILALALLRGRLDADEAWQAAHVDEDWQMEQWGRDEVALTARTARRAEFDAAVLAMAGVRSKP